MPKEPKPEHPIVQQKRWDRAHKLVKYMIESGISVGQAEQWGEVEWEVAADMAMLKSAPSPKTIGMALGLLINQEG